MCELVHSEGGWLCSSPFAGVNPPLKYTYGTECAGKPCYSVHGWVNICEGRKDAGPDDPSAGYAGVQHLDFWSADLYPHPNPNPTPNPDPSPSLNPSPSPNASPHPYPNPVSYPNLNPRPNPNPRSANLYPGKTFDAFNFSMFGSLTDRPVLVRVRVRVRVRLRVSS